MTIVEEYWAGVVQRLQVEVDVFNKLIGHAGEQGRENELALSRVLQNLIPRRLGVGNGIIIDSQDNRSKQTDIIIYDSSDQPAMFAQTSHVIYPVEAVYAAVEVKTTLTSEEISDCQKKRDALYALRSTAVPRPAFVVLAYSASTSPPTTARNIMAQGESRPDLLCVLDPGIVAGEALVGSSSSVALAPLHERDDKGQRIQGAWTKPASTELSARVQRFGSTYPVTMLDHGNRVIGEPGRALLLFLDGLLRILAARKALPEPTLSQYLTKSAREVLLLA